MFDIPAPTGLLVYLALLLLIATCGSIVAMRLFARARRSDAVSRTLWWQMSGLVAATTIWAFQYLSFSLANPMLADGPIDQAFVLSLVGTWLLVLAGMGIALKADRSGWIEAGGGIIGAGVVGAHLATMLSLYTGNVPLEIDIWLVVGLPSGALFGALAMNRIARPVTRFCKYGGALAFAGMLLFCHATELFAAITGSGLPGAVQLPGAAEVTLTLVTLAVAFCGAAAFVIDSHTAERISLQQTDDLALRDPSTGLANHTGFERGVRQSIISQPDDTASALLVVLDCPSISEARTIWGQSASEQVIDVVASRLHVAAGERGIVGRLGDERFAVLLPALYGRRAALQAVGRLGGVFQGSVQCESGTVALTSTIGVARYPDNATNAEELICNANLAALRAQDSASTTPIFYDLDADEARRQRSALAMHLHRAVDEAQLELHYQPQNDTASGRLLGFEALLRWHHPEHGMVSPGVFIPIAEETGQIDALGRWALQAACQEAVNWRSCYRVAVNVATSQLVSGDFAAEVADVLDRTGLPPARLELEITETGLIQDKQRALATIHALKALGVKIAMDDYGTGYSSLATLRAIPFDKIKIDREFIGDVKDNSQSAAIVQATIALGRNLGIPVLAEGVETEDQLAFLRAAGCDDVQGFLFGKPVPATELQALFQQDATNDSGVSLQGGSSASRAA